MSAKSRSPSGQRLLGLLLQPSWLSGLISITIGLVVVFGNVILTKYGNTVEQSLTGLHGVYQQSTIGESVQSVNTKFASNGMLNNVLLFLMWGLVGLVIYSIVESSIREWRGAERLLHELSFFQDKRGGVIHNVILRIFVRILALIGFWILLRLTVYYATPYAVAAAHDTAFNIANLISWIRTLLAGLLIVICLHSLTVLLRLMVLRARLFGSDIVD